MIKINKQEIISFLQIFILFATLVTIKMPIKFSVITLPLAILVLLKNREVFYIDKNLKKIFILFGLLLLFFSFYTIDMSMSFKGLYDLLRAFLVFFIAILLVKKVEENKRYNLLYLCIVLAVLLGNFFFERGSYFGYFRNPNNIAVEVFLVSTCSIVFLNYKVTARYFFALTIVLVSSVLLFYANSRAVVLGIAVASTGLLFFNAKNKLKIVLSLIPLALFCTYLFFMNNKNLSLSGRETLWLPLLQNGIENHFFFGTGLNSIKLVIEKLGLITHTAHNLFLEIFVSMGVVGLCVFIFLLVLLIINFYQYEYKASFIKMGALFGLIVMFVVFQFDLKFSGYPFVAIVFYFLGLLYSQRIKT